jgi:hypothetical protein
MHQKPYLALSSSGLTESQLGLDLTAGAIFLSPNDNIMKYLVCTSHDSWEGFSFLPVLCVTVVGAVDHCVTQYKDGTLSGRQDEAA